MQLPEACSEVMVAAEFTEVTKPAPNPFAHVSVDDYYCDWVMWVVAKGITDGSSDTTFSPQKKSKCRKLPRPAEEYPLQSFALPSDLWYTSGLVCIEP